jgi:hypothetical protein
VSFLPRILLVPALAAIFFPVSAHALGVLDPLQAQHHLTPVVGDHAIKASKDAGVSDVMRMQPTSAGKASVPATVYGFLPGYTGSGLQRLVSACVAGVPIPGALADAPRAGWQIQVDVQDVSMPRVATVMKATLLDGNQVVTSTWKRTAALDTAPRSVFCDTVSQLTQKLWATAAKRGVS